MGLTARPHTNNTGRVLCDQRAVLLMAEGQANALAAKIYIRGRAECAFVDVLLCAFVPVKCEFVGLE